MQAGCTLQGRHLQLLAVIELGTAAPRLPHARPTPHTPRSQAQRDIAATLRHAAHGRIISAASEGAHMTQQRGKSLQQEPSRSIHAHEMDVADMREKNDL
jgi:hypothetical protein